MTHQMREEYKASTLRRDGIIGQGRYVCQNTQLATGISVIHGLVQKNKTLPFLPKKLTETQEKSVFFSRRGVLSLALARTSTGVGYQHTLDDRDRDNIHSPPLTMLSALKNNTCYMII